MKLPIATLAAAAVCLASLAARSRALREAAQDRAEVAQALVAQAGPDAAERAALAAVDRHLKTRLHRLAQR